MKKAILRNNSIEIIQYNSEDELNRKGKLIDLTGYRDFISSDCPTFDKETESATPYYIESDDKIYEKWRVQINVDKVNAKISENKQKLSSTDYIVIKSYEAKLSMSDAPYSQDVLDKVIQERQSIRDEINRLEELIK